MARDTTFAARLKQARTKRADPTPLLSPQLARSVTRVHVEVERPWARPFRLDIARRVRS